MPRRTFDVFGEEWELKDSPDKLEDPDTQAPAGTARSMPDRILWVAPGLIGRTRDKAILAGVTGVFAAVFSQRLVRANLMKVHESVLLA